MFNKKIIIAGGTGFIGQALIERWARDNHLVILTRAGQQANNSYKKNHFTHPDIKYVRWNGKKVNEDALPQLEQADLLLNLAGKSVNCRYHFTQKKQVYDSRIQSTNALGEALNKLNAPPLLWVNASSATIYRHSLQQPNSEDSSEISVLKKDNMPANFLDTLRYRKNKLLARRLHDGYDDLRDPDIDFSVKVVKDWEQCFFNQHTEGTRKVALRTAITLGNGGVMKPYLNLCKFGLGGKHGNGEQMFSWVHIDDVAGMIEWLMENDLEGAINCVAPEAVTNKKFMQSLCSLLKKNIALPSPAWLLELGAWLIRTETELMLKSRWVIPARAIKAGYSFKYPTVENALKAIVK